MSSLSTACRLPPGCNVKHPFRRPSWPGSRRQKLHHWSNAAGALIASLAVFVLATLGAPGSGRVLHLSELYFRHKPGTTYISVRLNDSHCGALPTGEISRAIADLCAVHDMPYEVALESLLESAFQVYQLQAAVMSETRREMGPPPAAPRFQASSAPPDATSRGTAPSHQPDLSSQSSGDTDGSHLHVATATDANDSSGPRPSTSQPLEPRDALNTVNIGHRPDPLATPLADFLTDSPADHLKPPEPASRFDPPRQLSSPGFCSKGMELQGCPLEECLQASARWTLTQLEQQFQRFLKATLQLQLDKENASTSRSAQPDTSAAESRQPSGTLPYGVTLEMLGLADNSDPPASAQHATRDDGAKSLLQADVAPDGDVGAESANSMPTFESHPGPPRSPGPGPGAAHVDDSGRRCVVPATPLPNASNCIVLFWGPFYDGQVDHYLQELLTDYSCPSSCVFTADPAMISEASVVLFHDWMEPVTASTWPTRYCGQRWVYSTRESPTVASSWGSRPRASLVHDFDGISTYRLDSDIPFPYFPYGGDAVEQGLFEPPVPFAEKRTDALATFVARNCDNDYVGRTATVLELMAYVPIHSYGMCLHNKDWPSNDGGKYSWSHHHGTDMESILRQYKFNVVFENSGCIDYVTEKLWRAYRMGVVPIYIGAPNIRDFVPLPDSVILVSDFRNIRDLAVFLLELADDEVAYERYLRYKHTRQVTDRFRELWMTPRPDWQCRLCDWAKKKTPRQFWEDRSCTFRWGSY